MRKLSPASGCIKSVLAVVVYPEDGSAASAIPDGLAMAEQTVRELARTSPADLEWRMSPPASCTATYRPISVVFAKSVRDISDPEDRR